MITPSVQGQYVSRVMKLPEPRRENTTLTSEQAVTTVTTFLHNIPTQLAAGLDMVLLTMITTWILAIYCKGSFCMNDALQSCQDHETSVMNHACSFLSAFLDAHNGAPHVSQKYMGATILSRPQYGSRRNMARGQKQLVIASHSVTFRPFICIKKIYRQEYYRLCTTPLHEILN